MLHKKRRQPVASLMACDQLSAECEAISAARIKRQSKERIRAEWGAGE